jgi:hypothetical protein
LYVYIRDAQEERAVLKIYRVEGLLVVKNNVLNLRIATLKDDSVRIEWDGKPNATTWLYVYAPYNKKGVKHKASDNQYTYSNLASNVKFTVYIKGKGSETILQKDFITLAKNSIAVAKYDYEIVKNSGIKIVNISDENNTLELGTIPILNALEIVTKGNYAYVASENISEFNRKFFLNIVDISNKAKPVVLSRIDGNANLSIRWSFSTLRIINDYLYVKLREDDSDELRQYSISKPDNLINTNSMIRGYLIEDDFEVKGAYFHVDITPFIESEVIHQVYKVKGLIPIEKTISNFRLFNISDNSAEITWDGNPKAKTWLYVHAPYNKKGLEHNTTTNKYIYPSLVSNTKFTVYLQAEGDDEILKKDFWTLSKGTSAK